MRDLAAAYSVSTLPIIYVHSFVSFVVYLIFYLDMMSIACHRFVWVFRVQVIHEAPSKPAVWCRPRGRARSRGRVQRENPTFIFYLIFNLASLP